MVVYLALLTLRLPGCVSLKDKRHRLRGLIERARNLGASASEVGDQDLLGNAEVGLAVVGDARIRARSIQLFEESPGLELAGLEEWEDRRF